jgi:hypothetical protein
MPQIKVSDSMCRRVLEFKQVIENVIEDTLDIMQDWA